MNYGKSRGGGRRNGLLEELRKKKIVFSASEQMTGRDISEVHNALRQPDWQAQ